MPDNGSGDDKSTPDNQRVSKAKIPTIIERDAFFKTLLDLEGWDQDKAIADEAVKRNLPPTWATKLGKQFEKYKKQKSIDDLAKAVESDAQTQAGMLQDFTQLIIRGRVSVGWFRSEDADETGPGGWRFERQTYRDFHESHADLKIHLDADGEEKEAPATRWWQCSPDKRKAYGTTYSPDAAGGEIINGKVNLWWGFSVEPTPVDHPDYWSHVTRFLFHLEQVAGKGTAEYSYLLNWLCHAIQHPTRRCTALMFTSVEGTGKSLLFDIFVRIFGQHAKRFNRPEDIVGRFNSLMHGCSFAIMEEMTWPGDHQMAERLKSMITDRTMIVEEKYQAAEEVPNGCKYIGASNADHVVRITQTDRRWAIIESPAPTQGPEYFEAFAKLTADPVFLGSVLTLLQSLSIENWNAEADRPRNAATQAQKQASYSGSDEWWRLVFATGSWWAGPWVIDGPEPKPKRYDDCPLEGDWYSRREIYAFYVAWHSRTHKKGNPVIDAHFYRGLYKWLPEARPPKDKAGKDAPPRSSLDGRPWLIQLPEFDDMAEKFNFR